MRYFDRLLDNSPIRAMIIVCIIGVVLRLVLAPFLTMQYDMAFWSGTVNDLASGSGLYEGRFYWYTPVWGYFLSGMTFLINGLGIDAQGVVIPELSDSIFNLGNSVITGLAFNTAIKIPLIIADVLVSFVIYLVIMKLTSDQRKAIIGFAIWLLCPLTIWVSGVQAQFDSISVLGMMLSIFFLLDKKYALAGVFIAFGTCTKIFPCFILPLMIAYILANSPGINEKLKNSAYMITGFILMCVMIFIIPALSGDLGSSFNFFSSRVDSLGSDGIGALRWDNIIYVMPLLVLFVFCLSAFLAKAKENIDNKFIIYSGLAIASLFIWPFFPTVPQYILVLLPFMIMLYAMGYNMKIPLVALSIIITVSVIMWTGPSMFGPLAAFTDLISTDTLISLTNGAVGKTMTLIYDWIEYIKFIPAILMIFSIYHKYKEDQGGAVENATYG